MIKCANNDTLTINRTYLVDTGMPEDIALMYPAVELPFFNKRDDAIWSQEPDGYNRRYTVSAILDKFVIDSLRIYTYDNPHSVPCKYLIGQNFLKRFNVFFDMKNQQMGLQPIGNFQRLVNHSHRRFHFSTYTTPKGKIIITLVANYKGNFYNTAGLQKGDEIVTLNGILYKNITYEQGIEFNKKGKLMFDIIRKGKPLKIMPFFFDNITLHCFIFKVHWVISPIVIFYKTFCFPVIFVNKISLFEYYLSSR